MATIQQKIALVGADDVKKAIADIVNSGQQGFGALQEAINKVEAKQFDAELKKAADGAGGFFREVLNIRNIVSGTVFGSLAAGFVSIAKGAADAVVSIQRSAAAAGISAQNYQALAKATKDAGGSQDQLDGALRKFGQQVESQGQGQFKSLIDAVKLFIQQTGGASTIIFKTVDDMQKARAAADQLAPAFKSVLQQIGDPRGLESVQQLSFELEGLLQKSPTGIDDTAKKLRELFAQLGQQLPSQNSFEQLDQLVEKSKGDLASMGISLINLDGTVKKPEQALLEFIDAVKRISDPAEQAQRIIKVFGKTVGPELAEAIRTVNVEAEKSILNKQGILVTDDDIQKARETIKAFNNLDDAWTRFKNSVGRSTAPLVTTLLSPFTKFFEMLDESINGAESKAQLELASKLREGTLFDPAEWEKIGSQIAEAISSIDWSGIFDTISNAAQSAWDNIATGFSNLIDKIRELAASVGNLFESGATFLGQSLAGDSAFATGGYVRGRPGIDTNLAWLTDGEYVIRRDTVQKLGVGFLDALNAGRLSLESLRGFSLGGLVERMTNPLIPAFAMGGLNVAPATAGSRGRPVTVVLDGRKFAMNANDDVANNLLRFARVRARASAGKSPSRVR